MSSQIALGHFPGNLWKTIVNGLWLIFQATVYSLHKDHLARFTTKINFKNGKFDTISIRQSPWLDIHVIGNCLLQANVQFKGLLWWKTVIHLTTSKAVYNQWLEKNYWFNNDTCTFPVAPWDRYSAPSLRAIWTCRRAIQGLAIAVKQTTSFNYFQSA